MGVTCSSVAPTCLSTSSGVMWNEENKAGLLRHIPQAILFDSYGSSEGDGLGGSVSVGGSCSCNASRAAVSAWAIAGNSAAVTATAMALRFARTECITRSP